MNGSFYFMVFAVCFAANYGMISIVHAAPSESSEQFLVSHVASNRVVRQAPPTQDDFTPPPPPPGMWVDEFSRKKREAKGVGGSMPTRKG